MKTVNNKYCMILFAAVMLLMFSACSLINIQVVAPEELLETTASSTNTGEEIPTEAATTTTTAAAKFPQLVGLSIGDHFFFGSYEQDKNLANGAEDIEWRVLDVTEDGLALVISEYGLDGIQYNRTYSGVTWATCYLRHWLNDDFINTAFTSEEREQIVEVTLSNPDNPKYGTNGGISTRDRMFCLSMDEAAGYFSSDYDRECEPTPYARSRGAGVNDIGNCWWFLRTPGERSDCVAGVFSYGNILSSANHVDADSGCVRPAFYINLNS